MKKKRIKLYVYIIFLVLLLLLLNIIIYNFFDLLVSIYQKWILLFLFIIQRLYIIYLLLE
jgi:hypothetical protein